MSIARWAPSACLLVPLLLGCAANPSPVPVVAEPDALAALAGHWAGEYSSPATGRSGSIVFTLSAGGESATGDVVMVPSGSEQPLVAAAAPGVAGQSATTRPVAKGLTIRFVRLAGDSVSGMLDPYSAPDCDCVLTTTFTGQLHGDRIDGTFETRGDPRASATQTGRWSVSRRR